MTQGLDALLQADFLLIQLFLQSFQLGDLGLQKADLLLHLLRLAADAPLSSGRTTPSVHSSSDRSASQLNAETFLTALKESGESVLQPPLDDVLVLLLYQPHALQNVGDVIDPPLLLHRQTVRSLQIQTDICRASGRCGEDAARKRAAALRRNVWMKELQRLLSYRGEREEAVE